MKKTLTTAAMLAIIAAGTQVHADQINGQHVTTNDANHATADDGTTWVQDGGTWWHNTEAHESGTLAPDAPQIETPQPVEKPQPTEPPKVLPEQQTPPNPNAGAHLDAPEHIEKAPKPIEQKTPQPTTATDPTEEETKPTITPAYSINVDKETKPADIEKLAAIDIKQAESNTQTEPTPTQGHAVAKSIDFKTTAPTYQAKGAPLPATGEGDATPYIIAGIGSIAGAAALAIYLQRKGA